MANYTLIEAQAAKIINDIIPIIINGTYSHHPVEIDDKLGNILILDCVVPEGSAATLTECKAQVITDLQAKGVKVDPDITGNSIGGKGDTLG